MDMPSPDVAQTPQLRCCGSTPAGTQSSGQGLRQRHPLGSGRSRRGFKVTRLVRSPGRSTARREEFEVGALGLSRFRSWEEGEIPAKEAKVIQPEIRKPCPKAK